MHLCFVATLLWKEVVYIVYTTGNSSDLARLPIQQPCFQIKVSKVKSSLQIRGGHTVSENVYLCITVSTIIAKYSIVGLNKMRLTYNDCLLSFMFNLLTPVPPVTAHDKPWPLFHFRHHLCILNFCRRKRSFQYLPVFKPRRTRYESVNYGISNYWST